MKIGFVYYRIILKVKRFIPTAAAKTNINEGSQFWLIVKNPRILVLLNIPANPNPKAKMNPTAKLMISSTNFSYSVKWLNDMVEKNRKAMTKTDFEMFS